MSRRIDIELTSARPDGTWTWRAAGAQKPKGVLDGDILPGGTKAGDVLKVEVEMEVEGITVLSVLSGGRARKEPTTIELIPVERPFEPVTQTLAKRDRSDRPRRDRNERGDRPDRPRRDGERSGPRRDGPPGRDGERGPRGDRPDRPQRPQRPRFEPVPELPQRPKAKRLKPGKAHRSAILAELAEEQRPIAEKALSGGIPAVRQAVNEQNASLRAAGQDEIPAAGVLKMAEELLPRLRVAEWLDRADAAKADLAELDLRDLRSVVAAGDDPAVARDETTRALAAELKAALATKQEQASKDWLEDISLALGVGRVIRALKLSAEPPKAGMRFPQELAAQLQSASAAALTSDATADRWVAVLEALAFSPIRAGVTPASVPTEPAAELVATVTRLAPLLPQIATLFGITPAANAPTPKPLRPMRTKPERKPGAPAGDRPARSSGPAPKPTAPPAAPAAPAEVASVAEESPAPAPASAEAAPAVEEAAAPEAAPAVEEAISTEAAPAVEEAVSTEAAPAEAESAPAAEPEESTSTDA